MFAVVAAYRIDNIATAAAAAAAAAAARNLTLLGGEGVEGVLDIMHR